MPSCIWNTWLPGVTLLMRIVPVAGSRTCRNTGFRAGPPERPQIWLELTQKLPPLPNVVLVEGAAEVPTRIFGRLRTLKNSDEKTSLRRSPNLNDFCTLRSTSKIPRFVKKFLWYSTPGTSNGRSLEMVSPFKSEPTAGLKGYPDLMRIALET